jgi:hypothetical protein
MMRKRSRPSGWDIPVTREDQIMAIAANRADARSRRIKRLGGTSGAGVHQFTRVQSGPTLGCANYQITGAALDSSISTDSTTLYQQSIGAANGLLGRAYGFAANLAMLPNITEFTNLFEQYRITKVEYTFIPTLNNITLNPSYGGNDGAPESNEVAPSGGATATMVSNMGAIPLIFIASDSDDNSLADLTTIADMMQRPYRMYRGDRMFKWTIKNPSVNTGIENGGGGNALVASGKVSPWIQASSTTTVNSVTTYAGDSVKHYGCKLMIHNAPGNGLWSMKTYVKVWVECKHVK